MKKLFIVSLVIFLLALAFLSAAEAIAGTYTSNFPLTENPISEGGNWINGKTVGLDWNNVRTTPGLAFGTMSGSVAYADDTAILTGTWGPDQTVEATVYTVSQNDNCYQEVEMRLRSNISAHSNTGYEVLFKCSKTSSAYMQIVRWNGALGNFTYLAQYSGATYGVANGDVVKATIVGSTITVYINGVQKGTATDSTYATGKPGMGFYLVPNTGCSGTNANYGFTIFTASDKAETISPPKNQRIFHR